MSAERVIANLLRIAREDLGLDDADAFPQLREHLGFRSELRRDRQPELHRVGHRAIGAKEVQRTHRTQGPSRQKRARPLTPGQ